LDKRLLAGRNSDALKPFGSMEEDPCYLFQLFDIAWEAADKAAMLIDLVVALLVVFGIRVAEKRNRIPNFLRSFTQHRILEDDKLRLAMTFSVIFVLQMIFFSPYSLYKQNHSKIEELQKALDDKLPKLDGFIDQWMLFVVPGETNVIIIPQIHINNFGGSGSLAENFKLRMILATNNSVDAKPIDISDYYQWQELKGDQITVFRLLRQDLISEKASVAIEPGFGPRGWLAFKIPGVLDLPTNNVKFVISFMDVCGNEISVTNAFWRGKTLTNTESFEIPRTFAGSVNLVYTNFQLQSDVANGWRPPELPPGCSNIVIFFGASPLFYPRFMAEVSPDSAGTMFAIKDLPDFYLQNLDKIPGYSPRQKNIWIKGWGTTDSVGGKTFPYPIQPVVISNRLYVEVQVPFSNEKHKLVMSDSFDESLPIPSRWDRNYSTNYDGNRGMYYYELVNELTNPVLQVIYAAPNEVHINGIFQVDSNSILAAFGQQPQLFTFYLTDKTNGIVTASLQAEKFHETLVINSNETIASFGQRFTNEFFRPIFEYQRPIFKYPSNRNPGAFADWSVKTNKSNTNN
jgi:hypothetical protein